MTTLGTIEVVCREGKFMHRPEYSYKFDGDVFLMPRDMILYELPRYPKPGERFSIGDVSFVMAEYSLETDGITAVRETKPFWIAYYRIIAPITRTLQLIFTRFIITLAVWNLAEVHMGEIASLECIRRRWRQKK